MSSRVDREAAVSLAVVLGIAALAVLAPLTALSGIAANKQSDVEPKVLERHEQRPAADSNTYLVRCWQYGRLVFEKTGVRLDFEGDANPSRLRGTDRQGLPLVAADTRNATCLIRADRPDAGKAG
jgi:hypothetical protein